MNKEILKNLGLTEGEIKVYFALLELGNATSGPIVDKSGISKSKVYEILERLSKKGIVSQVIQEGIMRFQAANPRRLLELSKEKEDQLREVQKGLSSMMPELLSRFNSIKEKQKVTVFQGYEGMKQVFNDILKKCKKGDEYIVFSAVSTPDFFLPYLDDWNKERVKKGFSVKIIYNGDASERQIKLTKKFKLTEARLLPKEFNTPAVFNLYKNNSAILIWSKEPFAIVIESQEVTDSFLQYFKVLWEIAKK